jgi:hypothetical protein
MTHKQIIGSNQGSHSTAQGTTVYNVPALLSKEVDKVSALTATNIGLDPGSN